MAAPAVRPPSAAARRGRSWTDLKMPTCGLGSTP